MKETVPNRVHACEFTPKCQVYKMVRSADNRFKILFYDAEIIPIWDLPCWADGFKTKPNVSLSVLIQNCMYLLNMQKGTGQPACLFKYTQNYTEGNFVFTV